MVEFIDIPNEDGDITDFDFKVNGKVYHAGIDKDFEFGSDGIAPLAGCGYDNAADYADNLDKYISRANSEYFKVSDDDWSAIVNHFRDLIQANEDKYSDTWEDFGDEDWDETDDPLYGYGEDDLVESTAKKTLYESTADAKNVTDEIVSKLFDANALKKAIADVVKDVCSFAIEYAEEIKYKSIKDLKKDLPIIAADVEESYYDTDDKINEIVIQAAHNLSNAESEAIYQILCTVDPDFKNDIQEALKSSKE